MSFCAWPPKRHRLRPGAFIADRGIAGVLSLVAVIYVRVSTEDQAREGHSLEVQEEKCRLRAGELGCDRVEVFADDGVTGDILNRPGLNALRERIRQGGVDYFICLDPDRLARKLMNQLILTEEIEKAGVKIEFINFEWRDTPDGKLFYQLRGSIAEYEKAKIRLRTQDGKKKKAEKGGLTHNPGIYGYIYDKESGSLLINEAEARVVRMMYAWVLEGGPGRYVGPYEIARRLNDLRIPPPRGSRSLDREPVWYRCTVKRILENESYTGILYLRVEDATGVKANRYRSPEEKVSRKKRPREEWCAVKIPAIIDRQTWEEVQFRLREGRRQRSGKALEKYLLSGIVRCGFPGCGRTMHGNRITRRGGGGNVRRYRYYVCTAKTPGVPGRQRCPSSSVPADHLERVVWERVASWLVDLRFLAAELGEQGVAGILLPEEEFALVQRELEGAKKERARIIRGYQKGIIPEEEAEKILLEIEGKIGRLEERAKELVEKSRQRQLVEGEREALRKAWSEFSGRLEELSFEEKQFIIRLLVDEVIVDGRKVVIRARTPAAVASGSDHENSHLIATSLCGAVPSKSATLMAGMTTPSRDPLSEEQQ